MAKKSKSSKSIRYSSPQSARRSLKIAERKAGKSQVQRAKAREGITSRGVSTTKGRTTNRSTSTRGRTTNRSTSSRGRTTNRSTSTNRSRISLTDKLRQYVRRAGEKIARRRSSRTATRIPTTRQAKAGARKAVNQQRGTVRTSKSVRQGARQGFASQFSR